MSEYPIPDDLQNTYLEAEKGKKYTTGGSVVRILIERIARLEQERDELQATFDLRWKADMRAIKMWQAAHPGNDQVWPDHADLVVWLGEQLSADCEDFLDLNEYWNGGNGSAVDACQHTCEVTEAALNRLAKVKP